LDLHEQKQGSSKRPADETKKGIIKNVLPFSTTSLDESGHQQLGKTELNLFFPVETRYSQHVLFPLGEISH
jgi:hypothetical protein